MKRLLIYSTIVLTLLSDSQPIFPQTEKDFRTRYATVYYEDDNDVNLFLWRIGGGRFEFSTSAELALNRIDRIVEKVGTILDMRPRDFTLNVYLLREPPGPDNFAYYDNKTKSIYISIDNSSQGIFAHAVAHAIINQYFTPPTPSKMQDILTQYVDRYLWSDY